MSQTQISVNLLTQQFPYNFREVPSNVTINRGLEQNGASPAEPYFAENVLPITDGFSSVSFTEKVPANENITSVDKAFIAYGTRGRLALVVISQASLWIFDPLGGEWNELEGISADAEFVSYATIREKTYIHLGTGIYEYDFTTQEMTEVLIEGVVISATLGVTSAAGRLILWDSNRVYYSSPTDPTEFTPGLDTGAGSTGIEDLRGEIVACVTLGRDFIIYSKISAVSARNTDNPAFPFRYKEVPGSAGVNFLKHVAYNSNLGVHIVWTNSGFQQVSVEQAQYIWPDLSDGIIRGLLLRRDELFGVPELVRAQQLEVSLNFVSNRYIAVSIQRLGENSEPAYFDCYILDTLIERWGKLAVPHATFLEYVLPEVFDAYTYNDLEDDYFTYDDLEGLSLTYRQIEGHASATTVELGSNLGIVLPNAAVQAISFTETSDFRGTSGTEFGALTPSLFIGRVKIVREQGVETQWLKLRELYDAELFWYGHTYDGSFARVQEIQHESPSQRGHWFGRMSADSISLELRGHFKVTDLSICLSNAGQVNQLQPHLEVELVQISPAFPEPEYDYATSWLYSPFSFDEIKIASADVGESSRLVNQPKTVDLALASAHVGGTGSLNSIIHERDVGIDSASASATVGGSAEIQSIIQTLEPLMDSADNSVSVTGNATVQQVVISRTIRTQEIANSAEVSGSATLTSN